MNGEFREWHCFSHYVYSSVFATLRPDKCRKAGGLQIPVFHGIYDPHCQGIAVVDYSFTLDACWSEAEIPLAGALKPSSFCNVGVNIINLSLWWFKNSPFGIDIAIAIGIEINAMAVFVDFDSDPDSDSDGYSQYENYLS